MTKRSKTPEAAPEIHADGDNPQTSVSDIDSLIVRLRAAHDAGATIEELHAHLSPIIAGSDAGPLLELEPSNTEKAGDIPASAEHASDEPRRNPLLGTSTLEVLENVGGSSKDGPPNSFCYDKLLRFGADSQQPKSRKSAGNGPRGCYGFSRTAPRSIRYAGSQNRRDQSANVEST